MSNPTTRFTAGLVLAMALAACSSTAAPAPSATPPAAGAPIGADPTAVPIGPGPSTPADPGGLVPGGSGGGTSGSGSGSSGGGGSTGGSGGGSVPGDPGTGTVTSPPDNGGGGVVPDPPGTLVTPVAGLLNIRQIGATKLEPGVNGTDIAVRISWVSGVEPCSVLAGVAVARDGTTFKLTITEGSKGEGMACIEIAMFKATIVDLGKVDPGTYTITAFGDAPAVQVEVK